MKVEHTLEPVYDKNSITLILGSMPSVKSREVGKYYGHRSNRFWQVMSKLYDEDITDWKKFILKHNLALWDVIASCEIEGSSDRSIKKVIPNDISSLLKKTRIKNIFLLGKTAYDLYERHLKDSLKIEGLYLPSPSSANATYSLDDLIREYSIIKDLTNNDK